MKSIKYLLVVAVVLQGVSGTVSAFNWRKFFSGKKPAAAPAVIVAPATAPASPTKKGFMGNYVNRWTTPRKAWGLLGTGLGVAGVIKFAQKARQHHAQIAHIQMRLKDSSLNQTERAELLRGLSHHKRWRAIHAGLAGGSGLVGGLGGYWFGKHVAIDHRDADLSGAIEDIFSDYRKRYKKNRESELARIDAEIKQLEAQDDSWKLAIDKVKNRQNAYNQGYLELEKDRCGHGVAAVVATLSDEEQQKYKQKEITDFDRSARLNYLRKERKFFTQEEPFISETQEGLVSGIASPTLTSYQVKINRLNDNKSASPTYRGYKNALHDVAQSFARQKLHEKQGFGIGVLNPFYTPREKSLEAPENYEQAMRKAGWGLPKAPSGTPPVAAK